MNKLEEELIEVIKNLYPNESWFNHTMPKTIAKAILAKYPQISRKSKKARLVQYNELTTEEQSEVPTNGEGKESATYIIIEDERGRTVYSDACEPEDKGFRRDFSWIVEELNKEF